jgi:hypothetical protein
MPAAGILSRKAKDPPGRSEKSEFTLSVVEGRSDLSGKANAGKRKSLRVDPSAPLGMTGKKFILGLSGRQKGQPFSA